MRRSCFRCTGALLCFVFAPACTDVPEAGTGGAGTTTTVSTSGSSTTSTVAATTTTTSTTVAASSSTGGECIGAADGATCTGGLCCAGTCTVVDSNPNHCGACDRKCGGASPSCDGSACAAEVLQTNSSAAAVSDIFVDPDDSHVYWTVNGGNDPTAGGVYRMNLANDAVETIFANTPQYASVAVQGSQLLLTVAVQTNSSGVYKCPKDACSTLMPFGTALLYYPQGTPHLAVTPTQVAGQYYPPNSPQQSFRCNATTCANQSGIAGPHYVAADSTYLYRSSQEADTLETFAQNNLNATAVVYKTLSPGAKPRQLHVGDDGHLYWYELGNQSILRSTVGQVAGAVETMATGVDNSEFDMVERDGILYWIDVGASGWVLESCTANDCVTTRRVIGDVLDQPRVMAVSQKYVFVGTRFMGTQPPSYLERFPR